MIRLFGFGRILPAGRGETKDLGAWVFQSIPRVLAALFTLMFLFGGLQFSEC